MEGTVRSVARMRTAEGALAIIREMDPDTAVSLRSIRRLINTGVVPCCPIGRKKLVNVDLLIGYLAGDNDISEQGQVTRR